MDKADILDARARECLQFLNSGYGEYLAARLALLERLPVPGAILAASDVEKHLKAFLACRARVVHGHLKAAHWNSLKNICYPLHAKLSIEFLKFLQSAYRLRYTNTLPRGFNLSIYAREVLCELDHTIFAIGDHLVLRQNERNIDHGFRKSLRERDGRLWRENHVLHRISREQFLARPDYAHSVRVRRTSGLLEVEFEIAASPTDGRFMRPALRPVNRDGTPRDE